MFIGFSSPNRRKLGAEIIKWHMGTPYSHVYLRIYSTYTDQWLVYQASHGSVHLRTYDRFLLENKVISEFAIEVSSDNLRQLIKKAQILLGAPYGYVGLLKLALRRFFKLPGDGKKTFHCSEFIVTLFPELLDKNLEQDFVEPVHLYNKLIAK